MSRASAFWKIEPEVELCTPEAVDLYTGFTGAALMALAMPTGDGKVLQELSPKS